jgi:hypothetical protein
MSEETLIVAEAVVFVVCLMVAIYLIATATRNKKKKISDSSNVKVESHAMQDHMKEIYKNQSSDRMLIMNCPHCTGMMLRMNDVRFVFHCPGCDVYWNIKLIDKPEVKTDGEQTREIEAG